VCRGSGGEWAFDGYEHCRRCSGSGNKVAPVFEERREPPETLPIGILGVGVVNVKVATKPDPIDHPAHYGGGDDPYEAIKVIEAWRLGFRLGNAVKYIARAGKKDPTKTIEDLRKASWYLSREIERLECERDSS